MLEALKPPFIFPYPPRKERREPVDPVREENVGNTCLKGPRFHVDAVAHMAVTINPTRGPHFHGAMKACSESGNDATVNSSHSKTLVW